MIEAIAPFAGKVLAPYAHQVAKKLCGRAGITRWQIDRQVRSETRIEFDSRAYRAWLKSLDASVWERTVEQAAPELALDLDEGLASSGSDWRRRRHNASTALKLVQETYLAVLGKCSPAEAIRISEMWRRERNEAVVHQLANLASTRGGVGRLDGNDLATYLGKQSRARRQNRLAALGVEEAGISAVLTAAPRPALEFNRGQLRCIVGPFGVGKSEAAEEWHRSQFTACISDSDRAIPVWLHVRDLHGSLITTLDREAGSQAAGVARGVAVVIDGLDETDSSTAQNILDDSRVFLAASPKSSILLTTRPGVVGVHKNEEIPLHPLSNQDAARLVDAVSGSNNAYYRLPEPVRESVGRPLFAIAAGRALAIGTTPPSAANLLDLIVQSALRRGQERTRIASPQLVSKLTELAVRLTNDPSQGRSLDYSTRAVAEESRLVTVDPEGGCQFSLAIIQQWFAAQALLGDGPAADDAFRDAVSFGRWRWAVAIVVSMGTEPTVDKLLRRAMICSPGAVSWLLQQASVSWIGPSLGPPPLDEVQSRLLASGRSWADGLGPLASAIFPIHPPEHRGLLLGAAVDSEGIAYSWSTEPKDADTFTDLPSSVQLHAANESWPTVTWKQFGHDAAWPWNFIRSDIMEQLKAIFRLSGLLGGPSGVWADEAAYRFCRVWAKQYTILHTPIDCQDIMRRLDEILSDDPEAVISVPRAPQMEARWLRDHLAGHPDGLLSRPLPAPDKPASEIEWAWGAYGQERLMEYASELYGRACSAYEEICRHTFPAFAWTLSRSVLQPIAVLGIVHLGDNASWDRRPIIDFMVVSASVLERAITDSQYDWLQSKNGRCALRFAAEPPERGVTPDFGIDEGAMEEWMSIARLASPFVGFSRTSSVVETNHDRASSQIALKWLADDLTSIGMFSGQVTLD